MLCISYTIATRCVLLEHFVDAQPIYWIRTEEGRKHHAMRVAKSRRLTILACSVLIAMITYTHPGIASPVPTANSPTGALTSWNPNVNCTPVLVTIEQIIGNQSSPLGGATLGGSMFNPGTTSPYGQENTKRWLSPTSSTPPGWISPGQPCTMTNANGQVVSAFVQINGVQRGYRNEEDWNSSFMPVNGGTKYPNGPQSDSTFNIFTPGYGICDSSNTTGCMHNIHVEIDHDWKGASYCGPYTSCDNNTLVGQTTAFLTGLDVQGFVFWDQDRVDEATHNFSGWELHPLTAWRVPYWAPDFHLSASASNLGVLAGQSASSTITVNTFNLFSGNVSFSTAISPASNASTVGAAPTASITPSSVALPSNGFYIAYSQLTVTTAVPSAGNYIVVVSGTSGNLTRSVSVTVNIMDFSIAASPTSLSIPIGSSGTSTLTLTSFNGFSGNVSLAAQVTPASITAGLSPVNPSASLSSSSMTLQSNGTNSATLAVSASLLTTPGTYIVTITASNGGVTRTTTVTVAVTATPLGV